MFGSKDHCIRCHKHRPALPSTTRAQQPQRRAGDWDCACGKTFIFASKTHCPACNLAKPATVPAETKYERREEDWDCAKCGKVFIFAKHAKCPDCGQAQPFKDVEETAETNPTCAICMTNKPIISALPCGHKNYCFACSVTLAGTKQVCAICRKEVDSYLRVFD